MKNKTLITILCLGLYISSPIFAQDAPAIIEDEKPVIYIFKEKCLFKLNSNTHNSDTIIMHRLCNNPSVKGFDDRLNNITIMLDFLGGTNICEVSFTNKDNKSQSTVEIELSSEKIAAIFKEITRRLEKTLQTEFANHKNDLVQQLQMAKMNQNNLETEVAVLQRQEMELQQAAGQSNLSREFILNQMKNMEDEQNQLQMNLVSMQARKEAINREMAEIAKRSEAKINNDLIIENLRKIRELQKEKLDNLRKLVDKALAPQDDLSDQQEKIARTEIEIAERQEELEKQTGGGSAEKWNIELSEMSIQTAELEARTDFLNTQLMQIKAKNLLELANQYEREVVMKMEPMRKAYEQATRRVNELQKQLDALQPPSITILGGQPEPDEKKAEEQ